MDAEAKKTALRMIPYGIYVMTAEDADGNVGAATVNWVTQTSFEPPLVVIGVKPDSGIYATIKTTNCFALNIFSSPLRKMAQPSAGKLSIVVKTVPQLLIPPPPV